MYSPNHLWFLFGFWSSLSPRIILYSKENRQLLTWLYLAVARHFPTQTCLLLLQLSTFQRKRNGNDTKKAAGIIWWRLVTNSNNMPLVSVPGTKFPVKSGSARVMTLYMTSYTNYITGETLKKYYVFVFYAEYSVYCILMGHCADMVGFNFTLFL